MTASRRANLPASVRQRLLNLSRERGESFDLVLNHYAVERFLYRLAQSEHARRFILKGAMLFAVWTGRVHRPTRDLDLLASGDSSGAALAGLVGNLCRDPKEEPGRTCYRSERVRAAWDESSPAGPMNSSPRRTTGSCQSWKASWVTAARSWG